MYGEDAPVTFDGFISYSHAADDLLAPRLQAGLQKFAKPWWKRRAVRIFRDESSLAANPHLWSSITEALDDSSWFVLLLSEDAASSEWVGKEIEHWVANKDSDRILPVVTDGTFGWENDDVAGSSVPPALHGVFIEEPRWVDLRFARGEEHLDLQNPDFSAAVADIASTIRGVPKDELASEEVRQHRRTVRTAWAAGTLVTVLAIAAVVAGIFAIGQRNDAQDNAKLAEANAAAEAVARQDADANRLLAEQNAQEATDQRNAALAAEAEAEDQRDLARARELGASAVEALDIDPELATLLALEAFEVSGDEQPPVVVNAIWRAVQSDYLETVLPGTGRFASIDLAPDDSMLAVSRQDPTLELLRVPSGESLWTYHEEASPDSPVRPLFSPDGSRLALSIADSTSPNFSGDQEIPADSRPNRILILDVASGELLDKIDYPDCLSAAVQAWSPDGSQLVVTSGWETCPRSGTSGVWAELLDSETLESIEVWDTPNENEVARQAVFTPNGELLLTGWFQDGILRSGPNFENERALEGFGGFGGDLSPDGRLLVDFAANRTAGLALWDFETGERLDVYPMPSFPSLPYWGAFSDDGGMIVIQTEGRDTLVFDVASGDQLFSLPSGPGGNPALSSDGVWLYTSHRDGTVKVWNLEPKTVGQTVVEVLGPNDHVQGNPEFSVGPTAGSAFFLDIEEFTARTVFFSAETGEIIDELPDAFRSLALADGRFVHQLEGGEIGVYNPDTGEGKAIAGCFSSEEEFPFNCDDTGEPQPNLGVFVSVDQTEVMTYDWSTGEWSIISPDDGSVIEEGGFALDWEAFRGFSEDWIAGMAGEDVFVAVDRSTGEELMRVDATQLSYAVSNDGSLIAMPGQGLDQVVVVDMGARQSWEIEADFDRHRGVAFSPSDRLLAIGDENNVVIVDVVERRQVQTLPVGGASSFYWFDEETILLGTQFPARWVTISLNAAGLDDAARESVTRSFTDIECGRYEIEPCPTLEEIRGALMKTSEQAGPATFDGFISYSHAADDLLAPRLQAGLQKFAKPWWKRRAVRIFRDESSLAANPHLWSSITEALEDSSWFVLLLSPDAAQSEWVGKEIEHWVANKDSDRILPVVTDGDFTWENADVTGSSVPPALQGVFTEEPRWVDLRFARGDEHLDLQNPDFSAAVADIASTIRGIPKDELASEEVRQHRRTVRTAWAAGVALAVLTVAALVAGVFAIGQRNDAQDNAQLATARELAASAIGVVDTDPVLAKLLSLEAIQVTPAGVDQPVEVINSLWQAAASDRLETILETGLEGIAKFDMSADGRSMVVTSSVEDVVRMYDVSPLAEIWEWRLTSDAQLPSEDTVWFSTMSDDRSRVAVAVLDNSAEYAVGEPGEDIDTRPNRIVILDGDDGSEVTTLDYGYCRGVNTGIWSPDGARLAVTNGFETCDRPEAPSGWWVEIFDTQTWESQAVLDLPLEVPRFGPIPEFDEQGRLFIFGALRTQVYGPDYQLVQTFDDSFGVAGDATRNGSMIVASDPMSLRLSLFDTDTAKRLTFLTPYEFPQITLGVRFSSEDSYVIYGNDTRNTLVWDVASAEILYSLPGGTAEWTHLNEATMKAYTGHEGGLVRVWDLTPPEVGREQVGDLGATGWVDANSFSVGPELGAFVADDLETGASLVRFFDLSTGELVDSPGMPGIPGHNPERLTETDRIVPMLDGRFIYNKAGRWTAHDPETGNEEFIVGCESSDYEFCDDSGDPLYVLTASVDGGSIVARPGGAGDWLFFDAQTGQRTGQEAVEAPRGILTFTEDWFLGFNEAQIYAIDRTTGEFLLNESTVVFGFRGDVSPTGRTAVLWDQGSAIIVDTDTWTTRRITLDYGDVRAISLSPDDSLLAIGEEQAIHLVDLENDTLVQSVGVPNASDVYWLNNHKILVGTSDGSWATVSLNVQDLVTDVAASLLRGFTDQECLTYRIDPCPTLDEMRSR